MGKSKRREEEKKTSPTKEEKRRAVIKALGNNFQDKDGATFSKDRFTGDFIGLYFSANWCPPCRGFTPKLAANYSDGLSEKMEIVFLSSDRCETEFEEYLGEMPWLALPYSKRAEKEQLSELLNVAEIPTLVVMDKDFNIITTEGTSYPGQDGKGGLLPDSWKPHGDSMGKSKRQ